MIDNRICSLYNNIFVHHFFSLTINCMEQHSGPGIHQQRESENKKRWLTSWIFDTEDIWNDKEGETKGVGGRSERWTIRGRGIENMKAKIIWLWNIFVDKNERKKIAALKWNKSSTNCTLCYLLQTRLLHYFTWHNHTSHFCLCSSLCHQCLWYNQ